jgi:hypothetical protein
MQAVIDPLKKCPQCAGNIDRHNDQDPQTMPFDPPFRDATDGPTRRNATGRPRINPAAPLTPAERARRHRAKHGARINRTRRQRRKVAAILSGAVPEVHAHQRIIRDQHAAADPTEVAASLAGYTVGILDRAITTPLIEQFEWLGDCGNATWFVGLHSPSRELQGVAAFGYGPQGTIRDIIGSPSFCLERGTCTHRAPKNAASYLITHACKLIHDITGTARFFAYADPSGGEYGGIYQACGWAYLGQGLYGGAQRTHRHAVLPPGGDPDDPAQWQTCRALRRPGRRLSFSEAIDAGWLIEMRAAKHVYATHVGRDRKAWRKALTVLPYPKPRPELTMAARALRGS